MITSFFSISGEKNEKKTKQFLTSSIFVMNKKRNEKILNGWINKKNLTGCLNASFKKTQ